MYRTFKSHAIYVVKIWNHMEHLATLNFQPKEKLRKRHHHIRTGDTTKRYSPVPDTAVGHFQVVLRQQRVQRCTHWWRLSLCKERNVKRAEAQPQNTPTLFSAVISFLFSAFSSLVLDHVPVVPQHRAKRDENNADEQVPQRRPIRRQQRGP